MGHILKVLVLFLFIGCQQEILTTSTNSKLLGIWKEKGYNNKIEIRLSTQKMKIF